MTYTELQNILDKEGIGTYVLNEYRYEVSNTPDCEGRDTDSKPISYLRLLRIKYLYIIDAPLYLFPLKERIESILKLNDIKAKVEVKEEEQLLTIELEK